MIGLFTYFFWFIQFLNSFLINSGYPQISIESLTGNKDMKYCNICEIWYNTEKKVKHCSICDIVLKIICVIFYFIRKCIGKEKIINV